MSSTMHLLISWPLCCAPPTPQRGLEQATASGVAWIPPSPRRSDVCVCVCVWLSSVTHNDFHYEPVAGK